MNILLPGDEDCLFLNLYAPPASSTKLPVLVYVHGGGYGFQNGQQDMSEIINANQNGFIGISIQYRVRIHYHSFCVYDL